MTIINGDGRGKFGKMSLDVFVEQTFICHINFRTKSTQQLWNPVGANGFLFREMALNENGSVHWARLRKVGVLNSDISCCEID